MIQISVNYRLLEYLKTLRDFLPISLKRDAEEKGKTYRGYKWHHSVMLWLVGPPAFAYKKLRVGECNFQIDGEGVTRKSNTGEKVIAWSDVKQVHILTKAYLIELEEGALPLPFRCFTKEEKVIFEDYIDLVKPNKSLNSDDLDAASY